MGLTSSPRIFTKILKPVLATLRAKFGHSCLGYIDDSLDLADSYAETESATLHAVELLISLGFMILPETSIIIPTQVIEFLGFVLNSMLMIVQLTDKKPDKIFLPRIRRLPFEKRRPRGGSTLNYMGTVYRLLHFAKYL